MTKAKILVVDDEQLIRWSLKQKLAKEDYEVLLASSGEEALETIDREQPDLILQDIKLPGMSGLEILEHVIKSNPASKVIMMTAYEDGKISARAMQSGAYDLVEKPFDFEKLKRCIAGALNAGFSKRESRVSGTPGPAAYSMEEIMCMTDPVKKVFGIVIEISGTQAGPVLLEGESGTGKGVLARAIHYRGARSGGPFLEISCSSTSEVLMETELFGHESGTSDNAQSVRRGLLELAHGGTLLLDEIGDMPVKTQAKLLQAIRNRVFRRVKGEQEIAMDIRIIVATGKDLMAGCANGTFNEELYGCFKSCSIRLPCLRDRAEDIPVFTKHFIQLLNREFGKQVQGVSPEAGEMMARYAWPGNVRELKNVIAKAMVRTGGVILPEHLPPEITRSEKHAALSGNGVTLPAEGASMSEMEKELIRQALERSGWNQVHAAKLLKMSRDTLRYRMKKYNML